MTTYKTIQRVRLRQVCDGRIKFPVDLVDKPTAVFDAVRTYYKGADREMRSALCLNAQNNPTCFSILSVGALNITRTAPRDILKVVILSNSESLILIHNHPSGSIDPSPEDIEFTKGVGKACDLMGINLYDHLIITDEAFTSMRERGLMG